MTPQQKAEQLLHEYRMLFMDEGEDYGEEILVSVLSKQCALIAVQEIIKALRKGVPEIGLGTGYWASVKQEIEKL
jgi:hypothetical protein